MNVAAMLRREAVAVQKNERLFEAAVSKHFADQQAAIAAALGSTVKADVSDVFSELSEYLLPDGTFDPDLWAQLPEIEQQRLADAIAAGLLDWNKEAEKLMDLFNPLWRKTYDDGAALSEESYGLTSLDRPEFVSSAKINGGKRIVGIERTTRDKIADIIVRGVSEGLSQISLRESIQDTMGATKARAKLIARQETMTALATGQLINSTRIPRPKSIIRSCPPGGTTGITPSCSPTRTHSSSISSGTRPSPRPSAPRSPSTTPTTTGTRRS